MDYKKRSKIKGVKNSEKLSHQKISRYHNIWIKLDLFFESPVKFICIINYRMTPKFKTALIILLKLALFSCWTFTILIDYLVLHHSHKYVLTYYESIKYGLPIWFLVSLFVLYYANFPPKVQKYLQITRSLLWIACVFYLFYYLRPDWQFDTFSWDIINHWIFPTTSTLFSKNLFHKRLSPPSTS